jgi:hypothetical protein
MLTSRWLKQGSPDCLRSLLPYTYQISI